MDYLNSLMIKPEIEVIIDEIDGRKKHSFKNKSGEETRLATFFDREDVCGKLIINMKSVKKFEHLGIKIELIGAIEQNQDKKNCTKFITLTRDLEPPSSICNEVTTLPFRFTNVEKQYESYFGVAMRVR